MTDRSLGIYIHIPFCLKKCNYCDFCSYPGQSRERVKDYIASLLRHISTYSGRLDGRVADTVYFGGGTPTLLEPSDVGRILEAIRSVVDISDDAEISIECNPATADEKKLTMLRGLGVNRLSIGAQSFDDNELAVLGRLHSSDDTRRLFCDARRAGFDNISLDLMYGIPTETRESFAHTLKSALELEPEHISAYCLKVEQGTPFGRMGDSLVLPDDDEVYEMYLDCVRRLSDAELYRYEISNFARPGRHSRHNLRYWTGGEFVGFGTAAYSYFDGCRFSAPRDISRYLGGVLLDEETVERIGPDAEEVEFVMLSMRLEKGFVAAEYEARFGTDPHKKYGERFARFEPVYVVSDERGWHFTDAGMFVSNHILSDVLDL